MTKNFKLSADKIKRLVPSIGACLASDLITVEGQKIHYMYRELPANDQDSGWRFFAGSETEEYTNDPKNFAVYDVNTIANYDEAIIPYLNSPAGVSFDRAKDDTFVLVR